MIVKQYEITGPPVLQTSRIRVVQLQVNYPE